MRPVLTRIPSSAAGLADAIWIDLHSPTDEERAEVEHATGLRLPTQARIEEIEWSSRVSLEDEVFYLSTPVPEGSDWLSSAPATVGLVLSSKHLVTLRFASISLIDQLVRGSSERRASDALLKILDAIVDHAADTLERSSAELERISSSAFRSERPHAARLASASGELHAALRKLGRMTEGISHVRDTLLGVERITAFILDGDGKERLVDGAPRLSSLRSDVHSLEDYQEHLTLKVQFLLDATLGFISIQQNEIVKMLTIASVVGVPPVVIAGIYGMNFKYMPELGWPLGYPFALVLIVLSAVLPIAWFKRRGWM
jgi:magnesium transporter